MTARRSLVVVLVALLVVFGGATGIAAADTKLSITGVTLPDSVTQGDSFDLTVSVSGEELQNDEVDVSLTLPDGLSCSPSGAQTVTLTSGTAQATFTCTAEVEGDYSGEITVSASGTGTNGNSVSRTTQAGLTVISPASLTFATTLDASSITKGQSTTLTAVVQNSGDASTSYTVSVSSANGYSTSLSSGTASGTISGGEARTIKYTVTGDSTGTYTITTSVSAGNGQSLSESESLSVTSSGGGGGGGSGGDGGDNGGDGSGDGNSGGSSGAGTTITPQSSQTVQQRVQFDADGRANVTLTGGGAVSRVEISAPNATGEVTVEELPDLPEGVSEPPGQRVAAVNISVPNQTTGSAAVRISMQATALPKNATAADLTISHYKNGTWRDLPTTVVSSDGTVIVEASVTSFSPFAVTYQQQQTTTTTATTTTTTTTATTTTITTTPAEAVTPTGTPTATQGDGSGFGVAVALVALLAAALLALYRRE